MTTSRGWRLRRPRVLGIAELKASSGRLSGAIADQVFSSVTNFALGLFVARTLGPTDYGGFSLAFATYLIVLGISRSMSTDALMIRYSASTGEEWQGGTAAATGSAIAIGFAAGVLSIVAGAVLGGVTGTALIAMGVMMPGLMLQDSWRMAFFAAGRPSKAVVNDLVWVIVMFVTVAIVFVAGTPTVTSLTLAWGGGATMAGLIGFIQGNVGFPKLNVVPWWHQHRDLNLRFLGEFGSSGALTQLTLYTIGLLAGLHAVGAIRAALLVLGPFMILIQGGTVFGVAESARILKRSPDALYRTSNTFAVVLGAAAAAWGLFVWSLPDSVGVTILGHSWHAGRSVLVPAIVYMIGSGLAVGANTGLRALGAARASLSTRVILGLAVFMAGAMGAAMWGVHGAAWGIACANLAGVWFRWWTYKRALNEHQTRVIAAVPTPA
jgi:O-antigen/teichoic acid export membrane protein